MIAPMSNPDLQVNVITTMCDMTHVMTLPTHANLITVVEIVHQSSCEVFCNHFHITCGPTNDYVGYFKGKCGITEKFRFCRKFNTFRGFLIF